MAMAENMGIDELLGMLRAFTLEHYAKKDLAPFFQALHQMALFGLGVGTAPGVTTSGEEWVLRHALSHLQQTYGPDQRFVVLDVGANVGNYAKLAVQVFGPDLAEFHCFEPSQVTFDALTEALADLPFVHKHRCGLGAKSETVPFFSNKAKSGLASVYDRRLDHFGVDMQEVEKVELISLAEFADRQGLQRIHVLKMDVEGHELECLKGAAPLLEQGRIDFIQFEFGGCNIDSRVFLQDFWYALPNYSIGRVLRDGVMPIGQYAENLEMFLPQNFLAQLKTEG